MRRLAVTINAIIFLDALLMFALVPLLPDYVDQLGLSKSQAGIVVGAYSAAVLVAAAPVGYLSDRLGPKRLTLAGVVLLAVSTGAYTAADGFWTLLVARTGQGLSSAVSWTAALGWLSSTAEPARRGRTLGAAMATGTAGTLLGPLVGGVLGEAFGIHAPFVVCAVAAAVLVIPVIGLRDAERVIEERGMRVGARRSLREPLIASALVITVLVALVSGALETLIPLRLGDDGYSALQITVVLTAVGVVSTFSNYAVGRLSDRLGRLPIAGVAMVAQAAGLALLSLPAPVAWAVGVWLVFTPAISALYAVVFPLVVDGADRAALGHGLVLGLVNLAWGFGFMVGPAAGAAVAEASADAVTYAVLAAGSIGTAAWLWLALPSMECQEAT